ncbi:MAG: dUTP diphosphatase [Holosporales bacterium]|jgi:dUTP pyrophosphatase|nr:dUTP diphosphatase [Holosporales bacterium]
MNIEIVKLHEKAEIPLKATSGSAGFDLYACLDSSETIDSMKTKIIGTGVSIAIPEGHFGMMCPRSGLAQKFGITLLNSPGIIDSDYRGEIKCLMINLSNANFVIEHKMRIAQLLIIDNESSIIFQELNAHSVQTKRGISGFGSTGL